jgi:hypothetical protein
VPLAQLDAPQTVLSATTVQLPVPLHPPDLHGPGGVHALCGSIPKGTGVQVPTEFPTLHALHPLHCARDLSQQTPSTQLPVEHSWLPPHATPLISLAVHL